MDTGRIIDLADSGNLDALLAAVSLEAIADAWWRYIMRWDAAHGSGETKPNWDTDPDSWAEQVWQSKVMEKSEETARSFLRIAAERAPQESPSGYAPLFYLGAGPVEDFTVKADLDRLLWIEKTARESSPFRQALRNCRAWPPDFSWVPGDKPGTMAMKWPETDPLVEETVQRIQSLP